MLTIFDQLFLLALHEEKCTILPFTVDRLVSGLGGGILAELILLGKVQVGGSRKLEVTDATPTEDKVLDDAIGQLQKLKHTRKTIYWVKHLLGNSRLLRKKMLQRLVKAGVLIQGEEEFTWTAPYADSPLPNASAKYLLKSRLREVVLTRGEAEIRELTLLSLAKSSMLLNLLFTKDERKIARDWIYTALMTQAMKDPLAQSLQEIDVAVETLTNNA
ncbi:MAG: GPP34 family phosphoprotein [Anaerolineales bacterium]|nr:GPP34 family phosphoprotein [Anaerolineales bacterium]